MVSHITKNEMEMQPLALMRSPSSPTSWLMPASIGFLSNQQIPVSSSRSQAHGLRNTLDENFICTKQGRSSKQLRKFVKDICSQTVGLREEKFVIIVRVGSWGFRE